jgi:hypothetical protein
MPSFRPIFQSQMEDEIQYCIKKHPEMALAPGRFLYAGFRQRH